MRKSELVWEPVRNFKLPNRTGLVDMVQDSVTVRCVMYGWIHNGCKLKDGSNATVEDYGWFCKCCNYRVRRHPRNAKYKAKFRALTKQDTEYNNTDTKIDSSYFNKQQIKMIQKIAQTIPENQKDFDLAVCVEQLWNNNISKYDIVTEFDEEIEKIIELAYTIDPPNQISMIVEFERIKYLLDHIPTKQDIDKYSELNSLQYNDKFQSWEYLLDKTRLLLTVQK